MEPKPSDSGKKKEWLIKIEEEEGSIGEESSPSIKLGLGIGDCCSGGESHVKPAAAALLFTSAQLHEFHQQDLIFKYIAAGLPVPFHLIFPIWRSVATSFGGSANAGIYNLYPSFIGFSPQGFPDYRSMMDPEPGRCRRTDGKKWRCSREVVPDQKYCQRHMHRGRLRSRKHVEASKIPSESCTATTLNCKTTTTTINTSDSPNTESNLLTLVPVNLQLATPSSSRTNITSIGDINGSDNNVNAKKDSTPTTASIGGINGSNNNVNAKKDSTATLTTYGRNIERNKNVYGSKGTTTTGLMSATADNNNRRRDDDCVDGNDASYNHLNNRINSKRSINNGHNVNAGSLPASGFGFSPKSVLQVVGCSSSCLGYKNVLETELQRCKRTDGKKWRCGRDVVPYQKYCGLHLHRGAKKLVSATQSVTVAAAAPPIRNIILAPPPLAIPKKTNGRIKLDTNLSISIAASPRQKTDDEKSSSTSSDATTITDENGSMSHLAVSP
ncbi:Growth-regulating factor 12 [Camellia lanceoleosa]|uniref:Growth-regulating factor 12 n=1 Tax=Camellia lanceoleosa TaxID=1840588 RepID=A0ACC0ID44_9ERIC|nr:Growth-regulating factor 12 [Camellia lanceoleosa]